MKIEVSVLLDGELEIHEVTGALAALKNAGDLREAWGDYQTIGAALRREDGLGRDITPRVMAALAEEPTVLAPRIRRETAWQRPLVALAASAAGVAVVGWVALSSGNGAEQSRGATFAQGQQAAKVATAVRPAGQGDLQEYLLAHQVNSPSSRLNGGTQHIRMVSAAGGAAR